MNLGRNIFHLTIALFALTAGCSEAATGGGGGAPATGAGGDGTAGAGGSGDTAGAGGSGDTAGAGGAGATGTTGVGGSAGTGTAGAGGGAGNGGGGKGGAAGSGGQVIDAGGDAMTSPMMSFFVTSDTSMTGNLGGLAMADARCLRLATAVGLGGKTWRAYLSTETNPAPTNARDRIGTGPWYNARGVMVAANLAALHARLGDPNVFITERGAMINGQWLQSPRPIEHDILTGSTLEGMVMAGMTCADWTSQAMGVNGQVGHSDGMGPNQSMEGIYGPWNSSHATLGGCGNTAPGGGAGRLYCFATD